MGIDQNELAFVFLCISFANVLLMYFGIYKDSVGLVCATSINGIAWALMAIVVHA